jgi:hypothetical protein
MKKGTLIEGPLAGGGSGPWTLRPGLLACEIRYAEYSLGNTKSNLIFRPNGSLKYVI